jgi:hypothetical protein
MYATLDIAKTLFAANIVNPARLARRLASSPTLLLDLDINEDDAGDILASVKPATGPAAIFSLPEKWCVRTRSCTGAEGEIVSAQGANCDDLLGLASYAERRGRKSCGVPEESDEELDGHGPASFLLR